MWYHVRLLLLLLLDLLIVASIVTRRADHIRGRIGRRWRIEAVDVLLIETKILGLFVDQMSGRRNWWKLGRVTLLLLLLVGRVHHVDRCVRQR